jgi:hypothetical protein
MVRLAVRKQESWHGRGGRGVESVSSPRLPHTGCDDKSESGGERAFRGTLGHCARYDTVSSHHKAYHSQRRIRKAIDFRKA